MVFLNFLKSCIKENPVFQNIQALIEMDKERSLSVPSMTPVIPQNGDAQFPSLKFPGPVLRATRQTKIGHSTKNSEFGLLGA